MEKNENFNKRTQNFFKIRFKFLIKVLNFLKEMQAQGGAAIPQFNFNKKFPDQDKNIPDLDKSEKQIKFE